MSSFEVRSTVGGNDATIAYRVFDQGESDDPDVRTLLLIHGWAQSSRSWGDPLLERLAQQYRVIAIDVRGHGASAVVDPADYTAVNFAADIRSVLAAELVETSVVLAGWSYGGLIACDYLSEYGADIVDGLVLIGAITAMGPGEAGGRIGPAMKSALPDALSSDSRTAIRALGSFGDALVPHDRADLGAMSQLLFGTSLATDPSVRAGLFARRASYDDLLAELTIPALIVHGTADPVADVSAARRAEKLLPTVTAHYWEGGAHAPFLEDGDRFADQLEQFVDALEVIS